MLLDRPAQLTPDLPQKITNDFREAMRRLAASVMIITSRDADGAPHGMVASSVISVSMEPPSMLIAVNRNAGIHTVLLHTKRFCINLLSDTQSDLLKPFSTTALRDQRFQSDRWSDTWKTDSGRLPWLPDASASVECEVDIVTDYGTHSMFIGRVQKVHCTTASMAGHSITRPLVWLAGQQASLSQQ
ncbi:MAG: flavin reductase family protein [Burkholderiaceae bacterium]|nr:flavin reductase family protein [Burkholderiaceae bacterium]